jgi:glycerol uptake facilitator protein
MKKSWIGNYIGETIGVFIIVFFGCGLLHSAILHNQVSGVFQASVGWGFAVALAVWMGGALSGAHYNPAVTIALAWRRGFPWSQVLPYIVAQIVGGFLGAVALGTIYSTDITAFAAANNIVKTDANGLLLALMYAPYSPHPGMFGIVNAGTAEAANQMAAEWAPWWIGTITEFLATALLMGGILNFLDENQGFKPGSWFPLALGVLVTMIVFVTAPLSMTSLNPARDLGPRIWLALNGYGQWAFPGFQGGGSTVATVIGPILGALFGAFMFDKFVRPYMGKA